jgi:isoquinoline 1-oxidoreductase beta subunit
MLYASPRLAGLRAVGRPGWAADSTRFPTYVVAAPVLTVAAGSVIAPGKAYAVVPSPPQPENILDLGDVMVAATKQAEDLLVLEVTTDNRVVFRVPRAEVGQGITTALAMVVADEIDARLVDVDVPLEEARQDLGTAQSTGGSSSVRALWDPGALDCGGSPRPARYRGGAAHVLPDPQGDQARRGHDVKSAPERFSHGYSIRCPIKRTKSDVNAAHSSRDRHHQPRSSGPHRRRD